MQQCNYATNRQRNRGNVVGIATRIRAGMSGVRITVGQKIFSSPKTTRPTVGPTQAALHGDREYFSVLYQIQGRICFVTKNIQVANKTQYCDTRLLVYMNEGQNRTFSNVDSLHGLESKANISFKYNFNQTRS